MCGTAPLPKPHKGWSDKKLKAKNTSLLSGSCSLFQLSIWVRGNLLPLSATAFSTPTQKLALHYRQRKCHPICKIIARFSVNVLTVKVFREKSIMTWTGLTRSTITSNMRNHTNTAMNLPSSQKVQQVWCTPLRISNTKPKVPFHSAHTTFISKQIRFCLRYMCRLLHFKMAELNIDFSTKSETWI